MLHHSKNRIVAVDIARILTAMVVMTGHLWDLVGNDASGRICQHFFTAVGTSFGSPSVIFLFLAGYFACRNITWKKALDNAWWSFAPFVLWNGIAIAVELGWGSLANGHTWYTLFGFNKFIIPDWELVHPTGDGGYRGIVVPVNMPLWFMRDLTFLFLLSPILSKCAKYLFPAMVLASLVPSLAPYFDHSCNECLLSPYALAFFTAGCAMRSLRKETQTAFLHYYSPWVIALVLGLFWGRWGISFGVAIGRLPESFLGVPEVPNLIGYLLRSWILYQFARWIEVKIPLATPIALKFAPVTFLTFASHVILYRFLPLNGTPWVLIYPPCIFAIMAVFFFALKRWCRPLLHLVAHYKLRPDDLEPKSAAGRSGVVAG